MAQECAQPNAKAQEVCGAQFTVIPETNTPDGCCSSPRQVAYTNEGGNKHERTKNNTVGGCVQQDR